MASSACSRNFWIKLVRNTGNLNPITGVTPKRNISISTLIQNAHKPEFGLLFDIDGVLVRGKKILPSAKEAIHQLVNDKGQFWVPSIFVTNAGNSLRQSKAKQLSEWLDAEVTPDQVVMAHSPLRMFRQYQDKNVLVSGQGPVVDIARGLGFTKITTIDAVRHSYPQLDMVDHKRRKTAPCAFEKYFPKIEVILLFGEPVRWETNLQLIIDIMVTDGRPDHPPDVIPEQHMPVLACNMDLLWMAEAPMPRFAHGCFLHCLEGLYKKITGHELHYTALIGKPSEITYHHAEHMLSEQAKALNLETPRRLYCIGDNPETDIYGANLYHRHLEQKLADSRCAIENRQERLAKLTQGGVAISDPEEEGLGDSSGYIVGGESCESVLVCTGVYSSNRAYAGKNAKFLLNHNHRDFMHDADLTRPTMVVNNVLEAVENIFKKEGFS